MKARKMEIVWNKISSTGCKWFSWNAPGSGTPVPHSLLGDSLFPIFSLSFFLSSSLWDNKKRELPVWRPGRWNFFGTKSVLQAANGPVWMSQVLKPLCLITQLFWPSLYTWTWTIFPSLVWGLEMFQNQDSVIRVNWLFLGEQEDSWPNLGDSIPFWPSY